ncbi:MAG: hypothetical protein CL524_04900 [Aequorivita sp.]|nr:hypothetical protein [Aequorivita sp.]
MRKAKDDPKTPAKPSERTSGSSANPEGSASGSRGGIKLSEANIKGLEGKRDSHNEKYKGSPSKKANLGTLKAVFRRGAGAFSTSHRPSVSSRDQWAMARVNAFLHLLGTGKPKSAKYITDNDLLPASHPRSTKKSQFAKAEKMKLKAPKGFHWMNYQGGPVLMTGDYTPHEGAVEFFNFELIEEHDPERIAKQESFKPPKGVQEEAARGLEMRREFNRGGTEVGVARARNLSNGDGIPLETINRMVSFFARHEVDLKAPKNRDRSDPGYPGAGLIAWKLWGGSAGQTWANSIASRNEKSDIGKASKEYLEHALQLAKEALPDWAFSKIHQAARSKAGGKARTAKAKYKVISLLVLSQLRPSVLSQMETVELLQVWEYLQECFSQFKKDPMMRGRIVAAASKTVEEMQNRELRIEPAQLLRESQRVIDGQKADLKALSKTGVPIWNPNASLVFVVSEANDTDKARGEFLSGPDGRTFQDLYLNRLNLKKSDVCILDVSQIGWIEKTNPAGVIALGRTAKRALGSVSLCNLPHPKAVRRFGDSGEVERKLRSVSNTITSHIENLTLDAMTINERYLKELNDSSASQRSEMIDKSQNEMLAQVEDVKLEPDSQIEARGESDRVDSEKSETQELAKSLRVPILKADAEKKIVYGIVLDPYQIDSQDDWISPQAIEETAHDWLAKSRIIGFDHTKEADAYPVESSIIPYPSSEDYQNAIQNKPHRAFRMPFGDDVAHSGSWVLGTKLGDSEWDKVKSGELNAYSIGGYGKREPMSQSEMPKVEFIDLTEDR